MSGRLATELCRMQLANPTMLASGILGYTGVSMESVIEAGAGAVVTKSLGLKPRSGYSNPTIVQVDCGLLNAMGLPNPGISHFGEELAKLKDARILTIVSVYGFSSEEFGKVAETAVHFGADALELNVSCPHVKKAGAEIGCDPSLLADVVKEVKMRVDKPVIVKLTPNVADVCEMAKTAVEAGADAITAVNAVKAMVIDIETMRPILANKFGGLSGPAIKPIAVRAVYDVYQAVDVPVIGCGGIASWQDAVEFMLAGALAVQIGTAIAFKGLEVFRSVSEGIDAYLDNWGFENVKEIVGLAHNF